LPAGAPPCEWSRKGMDERLDIALSHFFDDHLKSAKSIYLSKGNYYVLANGGFIFAFDKAYSKPRWF
jgi:hypothetical protein